MTAINLALTETAAYLLTDGAAYDEQLVMTKLASKATVASDMGVVIAASGFTEIQQALIEFLRRHGPRSYDQVTACLEAATVELFAALPAEMVTQPTKFIIAGWSDTDALPRAVVIANYEDPSEASPRPAFKAARVRCYEQPHADGRTRLIRDDNAEEMARSVINIQRRRPAGIAGGEHRTGHIVGGYAQLTTITEHAVTIKVIERWPDRIGQPILPDKRH